MPSNPSFSCCCPRCYDVKSKAVQILMWQLFSVGKKHELLALSSLGPFKNILFCYFFVLISMFYCSQKGKLKITLFFNFLTGINTIIIIVLYALQMYFLHECGSFITVWEAWVFSKIKIVLNFKQFRYLAMLGFLKQLLNFILRVLISWQIHLTLMIFKT